MQKGESESFPACVKRGGEWKPAKPVLEMSERVEAAEDQLSGEEQ